MNNMNILKNNYFMSKENRVLNLFSCDSLVARYNLDTKELKELPYNLNGNGNSCSYSSTTRRHITKFRRYINDNYGGFNEKLK